MCLSQFLFSKRMTIINDIGSEYMEMMIQQLINGLFLGSIYALLALGYTMVYGIIKLINFAHGEVYMIGSFIG